MKKTVYAGTYTGNGSKGIYSFTFENGILSDPKLFCEMKNPKYIVKGDDEIIAVGDFERGSGVTRISLDGERKDTVSFESGTSCYIGKNGNRVYTANYHAGTFTALELKEDGTLKFIQTVTIREGAGCHQVLFWKDRILVPCLFLDRVMIYDEDLNRVGSIQFNVGTGPRHGIFTKDGEYLYLASELSNELFVIHAGDWEILDSVSVLPNGEKNKRDTAAVRLSEDETKVYVSTRTMDILSVVDVTNHKPELVETVPCGGRHPRDFILLDNYLLCANRFSNTVVSFEVRNGHILEPVSCIEIPEAVSLVV